MNGQNGHSAGPVVDTSAEQTGMIIVGPGASKDAQIFGLGLSKLTYRQRDDLDRAKRYARDQSIRFVLNKQQIAHQQNQQKASQLTQALSLMARLYVGSVSFEIREDNIRQMFSIFGPIKSLNMSYDSGTGNHKGFAFLEYEVPEAALLAKDAMNGKLIGGRNLKVGRPSNMPAAQPIIETVTQEAKQYHRVYVASVHPDLSENDITNVFEAFGEITKVQLARQPHGRGHRGFGYLEFTSEQAVKEAIEGMNNFDLGGQYLQVGRCITPPEALMYIVPSTQSILPTASAVAAASITAKIQAREALKKDEKKKEPPKRTPALPAPPQPKLVVPPVGLASIKKEPDAIPAPPAPKLVVPTLSSSVSIKKEPNNGIDSIPVPPPPKLIEPVVPASSTGVKRGFFTSIAPDSAEVPQPPSSKPTTSQPLANSLLMKINTERKIGNKKRRAMEKAAAIQLLQDEEEAERPGGQQQLMLVAPVDGPVTSNAIAIRNNSELATINKDNKKAGTDKKSLSLVATGVKRKRKVKIPKDRKPKLNSAGAMAAVFKAGAINDQMRADHQLNDEATLASQEHVEIRGNDARHMLMHKLMRTNRSTVMVLKNMIDVNGVDEELEDEIRDECTKYGTVTDVVIAKVTNLEEVRIFVRFADPTQVESAIKVFDGRYFDGRTVKAEIYDQILFDHDDFAG